ncbi:tyrosine-type recombinase/integrase [Proteiniphilum propionicum]|uniref:tyrosine-type recombinase/integrase n=1 Tax=Proteiniphilum propionicum TaxID=2829812 RepID=UPI001EEB7DCA|nr:site-specific integrase [Proteiniphilum propionicum]ULB35179.1 site-specific integrase [Proteiniphilum propionicum]
MKYYYSNGEGLNVRLFRDIRRRDKSGDCPLRWCITFNRKRIYYSTGKSLNADDWELFEKSEPKEFNKKNANHLKPLFEDLSNYFNKILEPKVKSLSDNFSFDALNIELGKSDIKTVNDAFNSKIDALIKSNRIGNSTIYKTVRNSLENYKGKNISFNSITVSFLNNYEAHLTAEGVKTATISLYIRTLRAIINNDGKPYLKDDAYPFGRGKYLIKTSKGGEKIALTLRQIHAIESLDCGDQLTEFCRDLWLFSFYGSGINFTDIFRLKYTDIVLGELNFVRYKTRNTRNDETYLNVPILEPMKKIIKKHGNTSKGGYIFPLLNDCTNEQDRRKKIFNITHESNKRIKAICRELKHDDGTLMIPDYDSVNNYTARHSYATILNKLRVPESFISQQLGHSTQTVTQGYFGAYDRDARFEYNSLLLKLDGDSKVKYMNVI